MAGKTGKKWIKKANSLQLSAKFDDVKAAQKCYKFLDAELKEARKDGDVKGNVTLILRNNKVSIKADGVEARNFFTDVFEMPYSDMETFTDENGVIKYRKK